MSYRKGYYKKDGTYVQGHFVNKNVKKKKNKSANSGCLGIILLFITTGVISCTIDSNCASKNCSDFNTQAEAQATFNSDRACHSNLDRDNDNIACEN